MIFISIVIAITIAISHKNPNPECVSSKQPYQIWRLTQAAAVDCERFSFPAAITP